jgi:hypothetical protein
MCGEYGVVATAQGDSTGSQGRGAGFGTSSSGRSGNRSEIRRALIKPEEIIQEVLVQIGSTEMRVPDASYDIQAPSTAFQTAGAVRR